MTDGKPYMVGKNKPPVHSRFKKGNRPPPRRRDGSVDVIGILEAAVEVEIDGRKQKRHPFEVTLLSLLEKAVKKKDMSAARKLIELWEAEGLIHEPGRGGGGPVGYPVGAGWDPDEWVANFLRLGPPPWSGARDGLRSANWREEVLAGG